MDISRLTARELREFAAERDIPLRTGLSKQEMRKTIEANFDPANEQKVALYFPNPVHSVELGAVSKGYHVFDKPVAEKWLVLARRSRIATAEEIAEYYGV